ncbi:MAG: phage holin family protein [Nitrospirae bacterium]|nr:phage holin family protein [Nitrospirota bacterium]MBI3377322.1 phage holin family protein [Nitrospirota bacterium]
MTKIFITWLINTIAIMLAIKFVPGITFSGEWWGILLTGVVFGIVNTFIRPLVKFFTLPLLIFSLGLFTFVINAAMLGVTSWVSERMHLGFHVDGFKPAFIGAFLISIVSMALSCLVHPVTPRPEGREN